MFVARGCGPAIGEKLIASEGGSSDWESQFLTRLPSSLVLGIPKSKKFVLDPGGRFPQARFADH